MTDEGDDQRAEWGKLPEWVKPWVHDRDRRPWRSFYLLAFTLVVAWGPVVTGVPALGVWFEWGWAVVVSLSAVWGLLVITWMYRHDRWRKT